MSRPKRQWRGYALSVGAFAWLLLAEQVRNSVLENLFGGVGGYVVWGVLIALALYWLLSNPREWVLKIWPPDPTPPDKPDTLPDDPARSKLRSYSEQAERWLLDFGSDDKGMVAAEWFRQKERELRSLVTESEVRRETVEDLAWICDALEAGYVRGRRAADLLELSDQLAKIGEQTGQRDLVELAAVRAATAYRLMGNLDEATYRLGVASSLAPRGRTAAAMRTRREVERGLVHLARADRRLPGADRTDALQSARDRFDDAGSSIPRADLTAPIAIHLNIAVVYLYQHNASKALDHLRLAAARASAARDASAEAHALELTGVATWLQGNRPQALRWWHAAQSRYADIAECEGEARCLQHLGSEAFLRGATDEARKLLERSAQLRGEMHGHEVLEYYLAQLPMPAGRNSEPAGKPVPPDRVGFI